MEHLLKSNLISLKTNTKRWGIEKAASVSLAELLATSQQGK